MNHPHCKDMKITKKCRIDEDRITDSSPIKTAIPRSVEKNIRRACSFYGFLSKSCINRLCRLFKKEHFLRPTAGPKKQVFGKKSTCMLNFISFQVSTIFIEILINKISAIAVTIFRIYNIEGNIHVGFLRLRRINPTYDFVAHAPCNDSAKHSRVIASEAKQSQRSGISPRIAA